MEEENAILPHPSVFKVALVSFSDHVTQVAVKTIISLKHGMSATKDEIIYHCRQRIVCYKKSKYVVFMDDTLPKNLSVKVLKFALKDM